MMTFYCDGLCEPRNPGGYACWGWVLYDGGEEVARGYGSLGRSASATNNAAEYEAILQALRYAQAAGIRNVEVRSDSQLAVMQIRGEHRCNQPHLAALRDRALRLMEEVGVHLRWIPREQNDRADTLSRIGYDRAQKTGSRFGVWEALTVEGNEVGS